MNSAIAYKCPSCGAFVQDRNNADILYCQHCGNTISKYQTAYDKRFRYLLEENSRDRRWQSEQLAIRRKNQRISAILLGAISVVGFVLLYLFEKGII